MANWFLNNGDGLTTGYWAVVPWKRATVYPTNSIVRQRGGAITFGIAQDFTNGFTYWIDLTNNGQWNDSATANPATNTGGIATSVTAPLFPAVDVNNYSTWTANFGATAFVGTIPSGFSSVNAAAGTTVTWNPSDKNANIVLASGNLQAQGQGASGNNWGVRATASFSAGLIYWECTFGWQTPAGNNYFARVQNYGSYAGPYGGVGMANASYTLTNYVGQDANSIGYLDNGGIQRNSVVLTTIHNFAPVACGNERCFINLGSSFTSGATQPSWSLNQGGTTTDGTGTWTECTGQAAYGWNAPWSRLDVFQNNRGANGDTILVGDNSTVSVTGNLGMFVGPNPSNQQLFYISVDHTVASPTAANALPGATWYFMGATISIAGNFLFNGFTFTMVGTTNGNPTLAQSWVQRFTNCTFNLAFTNTGASSNLSIGGGANNPAQLYFENVTVNSQSTTSQPLVSYGARLIWRGGAINTVSSVRVWQAPGSGGAQVCVWMEGVDMSGVSGGPFAYAPSSNFTMPAQFYLSRCKLPAIAGFLTTPPGAMGYPEFIWYNCDSGTDQESHGRCDAAGYHTDNKTVIRTGGASDSLANYSEQIVTNSSNAYYFSPFRSLPMHIWNAVTGSTKTITLYGIANQTAIPQTTDLWMDVRYLGSASSLLGSEGTTRPTNHLTAGTNYAADTSAWDSLVTARANGHTYSVGDIIKTASNAGRIFFCTTGGASAGSEPGGYATAVDGGSVTDNAAVFRAGWRFKMAVTLSSPTPQLAGLFTIIIEAAKQSTTIFIDPPTSSSVV